jgi:methionine aminopeptidase
MKKGVAFPTCINVNEIICHFSPYKGESEESDLKLKEKDVVRM